MAQSALLFPYGLRRLLTDSSKVRSFRVLQGEDAHYDVLFLRRPILSLPACLSPDSRVAGVPSFRSFRRGAAQLRPRCLRGISTVPAPPCAQAASLGSGSLCQGWCSACDQ